MQQKLEDKHVHKGLRKQMVDLLREKGITDESVLTAINAVPRHFFLDSAFVTHAYEDRAFPIGEGQTISHPHTVAYQTQLLQINKWGMREWFALTFLMGSFFIAGQVYEYAMLVSEGLALSTNAYSSVFYVATGFHGLHVTGGLIAFLIVMVRVAKARRFTHQQATTAIVVSYYWHFVDVVWIALFAAIYLIK